MVLHQGIISSGANLILKSRDINLKPFGMAPGEEISRFCFLKKCLETKKSQKSEKIGLFRAIFLHQATIIRECH